MVLIEGCPIYTLEGDCLGTLGDHQGAFIEVLAPGQPTYWVPTDAIAVATIGRITLAIPAAQVAAYQATAPRAA